MTRLKKNLFSVNQSCQAKTKLYEKQNSAINNSKTLNHVPFNLYHAISSSITFIYFPAHPSLTPCLISGYAYTINKTVAMTESVFQCLSINCLRSLISCFIFYLLIKLYAQLDRSIKFYCGLFALHAGDINN